MLKTTVLYTSLICAGLAQSLHLSAEIPPANADQADSHTLAAPTSTVNFPLILSKQVKSISLPLAARCSRGFPLLNMTTEGLEHQNELSVQINNQTLALDSRWNVAQGLTKTASMRLAPGTVKPGNEITFTYGESSRDTTKTVTIHAISISCGYELPRSVDLFIDGYNGPVAVADESTWNPRDLSQVTNPHPQDHPEFTALLARDDLHWADSLRPLTNDPVAHNHYYGARRNAGAGGAANNPRMSYLPEIQASRLKFVAGELGQPVTYQTRIRFPELSPSNTELATLQWQFQMPPSDIRGGKQFQIADGQDSLHFEYNAYYKTGRPGSPGGWATVPVVRTYSTAKVGGSGFKERLSADRPRGCIGINRCASQPALPFGEPKSAESSSNYTLNDHVSLGGTAYLTGDEFLSGWITVTVTFDWRDPAHHKVWMWLADERTPATLVIGEDTDGDGWGDSGFPLTYVKGRQGVGAFWLEFNNSSSRNQNASYVDVRNFVAVKGAILPLRGSH